jgi:hypothetical protein
VTPRDTPAVKVKGENGKVGGATSLGDDLGVADLLDRLLQENEADRC